MSQQQQQQRHQFHLRWSNYGQNLANSFLRLFESESLSDVTLFCEGESYRAHRVVLAASSVHFQDLFEQCSTAQNLVVILDGTLAANLRALLEFMYKGEVYIDDANLNTFLQTAKRLQVKGLSLSQNDLHSISSDVDDRIPGGGGLLGTGEGKHGFVSSGGGNGHQAQDPLLAQALGPLLIPSHQQPPQPHISTHHIPLQNKNTNSVQSPPTSFSSPSPSRSPPNSINVNSSGMYGDDKMRKKNRVPPASPRQSPNGALGEGIEYSGIHHPVRPSAPLPAPSPTINTRMEMEMRDRQSMVPPGNFGSFGGSHYAPSVGVASNVPPPVPLQQSHQQAQQQTIVITENPNMRKIRSASTENTMPEDLSIKLEVGREDELGTIGISGKQRSYSMDLSPSEAPFGAGGSGGPPPSSIWPLPSPSSISAQHAQSHDLNHTQTTADGKKLKCPFCERLYGYETNLRAHIRQRHQGIRVPCPFCTRTFTRNNTVRRHVAREHRALLGGVGVGVRSFPHMAQDPSAPTGPPFPSPPRSGNNGSSGSSPSQGSPGNNSGGGGTSGMNMTGGQVHHGLMTSGSGHSPPNRPNSRSSSGGGKGMD